MEVLKTPNPTPPCSPKTDNLAAFLAEYLDLDLNKVTETLKEKGVDHVAATSKYDWMGKSLKELKAVSTDQESFHVDELDCYHGDFKHRKRHLDHMH